MQLLWVALAQPRPNPLELAGVAPRFRSANLPASLVYGMILSVLVLFLVDARKPTALES
jgi:hypothetical protein